MDLLVNDILSQSKYLSRAVLLMPLLVLAFLYLREHRGQMAEKLRDAIHHPWSIAFFLYLSYMLVCTLFDRMPMNPYHSIFKNFGFGSDPKWNNEIIENILLFIPYIFLLLKAFPLHAPVRSSALIAAGTTLFIELSQLLFWLGEFQLSDLFHNLLGGMMGCGLWYLTGWVHKKWRNRNTDHLRKEQPRT